MKTVLTPIDFSPISEHVIQRGTALAQAVGARLILLHVITPIAIAGNNMSLTTPGPELVATAEKEAAVKMAQLQARLRNDGVTAHIVHVCGDARQCIVQQAERFTADYIVMGSHGHTAFYDLLVGSTANAVLKAAPCPVMIVPPNA